MALRMSLQLPATSSISPPTKPSRLNISSLYIEPTEELTLKPSLTFTRRSRISTVKAIEESQEKTQSEIVTAPDDSEPKPADELAELGAEIKELKKTMSEKGEVDFWSGVAEEIKEIEWPAFGKVLGTTGVVLGVIAGSSVVLLTVNAVLAELSDKVFAGRGVQDFFG